MIPSVAKRRNIASIRWGGSFAPPPSHQVMARSSANEKLPGLAMLPVAFGAEQLAPC